MFFIYDEIGEGIFFQLLHKCVMRVVECVFKFTYMCYMTFIIFFIKTFHDIEMGFNMTDNFPDIEFSWVCAE